MSWQASQIGYSPQIDTLRAFAVGGVLYSHYWVSDSHWGHWGVRLFFVLSGYLITAILLSARDGGGSLWHVWKSFYIRRALRIFPAYYALLAAGLLISPEVREVIAWHALYGSNLLFAVTNDWGYWPLAHLWSLSVEEQFYVAWPFIVLLAPRRALAPLLIGLIASAVLFRLAISDQPEGPIKYVLPPAAFDALGAGGLLAVLERYGRLGTGALWLASAGAIGALAAVFWLSGHGYSATGYFVLTDFLLVLPMAAAVIACRLRLGGAWALLFEARIPRYLGRISYGIYLYHFPVLALLFEAFELAGLAPPAEGPLRFFVAGTATVCIAALSWRQVERPALQARSAFAYAPASAPRHPAR